MTHAPGTPDTLSRYLVETPRLRLILLVAMAILHGTAILATWHVLRASRADHEERAVVASRNLAELADQSLSKSVEAFDLTLKGIRFQLERALAVTGSPDREVFNALLSDYERSLEHSAGIRVSDETGRVILGHDVVPESQASWADRDFFALQRDNPDIGITVTDPIYGRVSKIWVISFARRYNRPDGAFAGVISIAIPVAYFEQLLSSFQTGPAGIALLRDSQARLIARHPKSGHPNAQFGADRFSPELRAAIDSPATMLSFHSSSTADEIERTSTYRRLSAVPFHLVVGLGSSDYLAGWSDEVRNTLWALALFLTATGGGTWLLWRSIVRLKAETERSRSLLKNASDGIHILDRDGHLIEASDSFCAMLGRSRQEMIGRHVSDWDRQWSEAELREIVADHIGKPARLQFETLHQHRDGHLVPVEVSGFALTLNDQPAVFYSSRDISEKLRDQAAMVESEARFRTLFESSPDPVWIIDGYHFVECNQAAVKMLGYDTKAELLGTHPSALSSPLQPDGEASYAKAGRMMDMARAEGMNRFEWVHVRKDGSEFIAEVTLASFSLHGRQAIYCQWRDITVEKRAEAELEHYRSSLELEVAERTRELDQQRSQFETILNNIPGVVGYWDKDLINRFANPVYCEWLGIERLEGRKLEDLFTRERVDSLRPHIEAVLAGEAQHFTTTFPLPGNPAALRQVDAHYVPDRLNGEIAGFFVLAFDITDLKAAIEAAEAANRAKTIFLANMSHELRTPMNGVLGMVGLARKRMTDPKGQDQLDKATQSAERLLAILNDILDLSKIEAERLTLEEIPFTLGAVEDSLGALFHHQAASAGTEIAIDLADGIGAHTLLGDPLRIGQVLNNLVGNALKFGRNGRIDVRIRAVEVRPDRLRVRFEVEDRGIGIGAADQKRLFSAFEQADGSTTRRYGGTGLGLAICRRLVESMGGEIGLDSTLGTGSLFWFEIALRRSRATPAEASPASADSIEAQLKAAHAGAHVLLAEDEPISREVARTLLEDVGLAVDLAEDGLAAVEHARRSAYDLVLMDMQMPNLNGVDAARQIRRDSLNRHTPIVAMTANAFDADRQRCLDAGMNEHLAKPVDPEALFKTVLAALSGRVRGH